MAAKCGPEQGPGGRVDRAPNVPPCAPFEGRLDQATMQQYLARDMLRRNSELTALGWVGRAYLALPGLFDWAAPQVLRLQPYPDATAPCYERPDGTLDVTLAERSVVGGPKGIPFRLELPRDLTTARVIAIGCDLAPQRSGAPMSDSEVSALCARLCKRVVAEAITECVFGKLARAAQALTGGAELECCGDEVRFVPQRQFFGREGTSDKWVQLVSGWYFAEALIQEVQIPGEPAVFAFYLDETEPLNSEDPTANINPEIVSCRFC